MPDYFNSQHTGAAIDQALSALLGDATGANPSATVTELDSTDTLLVYSGSSLAHITWANVLQEVTLDNLATWAGTSNITTVGESAVTAHNAAIAPTWANVTGKPTEFTASAHTHVATEITDFDTEVSNNSSVTANTAKNTNATHTGDVTGSASLTIADEAVTNAKLAHMPQDTIKGRTSGAGTGDAKNLTAAEVRTIIGVENGATADQSAAEIRALVESATDSNVFTNADHTKLDGIESAATADQTASEIRALVESATDSNVFTDTDHSKLNAIESSATADQSDAEIKTAYEANADTNEFSDAEKTKLTGIESGATADQTGAEIKTSYEAEANTNAYTDSEKAKLGAIDATHYGDPLQSTTQLIALSEANLTDKERRYVEDETADYFYDSTATSGDEAPGDQSGSTGFWRKIIGSYESGASIKVKYESNADTNAFTDSLETKLNGLVTNATHTGDVSGNTALTIANGAVSLSKMADISTDSFFGRSTTGTGTPEILSASEARSILGVADGAEVNPAVVSQSDAEAGTATDERIWTAQRVSQAIAALAGGGGGSFNPVEAEMLIKASSSSSSAAVNLSAYAKTADLTHYMTVGIEAVSVAVANFGSVNNSYTKYYYWANNYYVAANFFVPDAWTEFTSAYLVCYTNTSGQKSYELQSSGGAQDELHTTNYTNETGRTFTSVAGNYAINKVDISDYLNANLVAGESVTLVMRSTSSILGIGTELTMEWK